MLSKGSRSEDETLAAQDLDLGRLRVIEQHRMLNIKAARPPSAQFGSRALNFGKYSIINNQEEDAMPMRHTGLIGLFLVWAGCATVNNREITLDQLAGLARQPHTYEDVVSRFGVPDTEWQTDTVSYAGYRVNDYGSALSNIDGKGFVPGLGGFVDTYKLSETRVTLSFDKKTGKYLGYSREIAQPLRLEPKP